MEQPWEYRVEKTLPWGWNGQNDEDMLNKLGSEHWELVGLFSNISGHTMVIHYYFKRAKRRK